MANRKVTGRRAASTASKTLKSNKLPYMVSPGLIPKILEKIHQARRPDRFTQDFLETKLGHSGGGARPIIPLLKRMGFLGSDGVPTPFYDQFRNTDTRGIAIAEGMKNAFNELFERNEYVYDLPRDKLTGQVVEITGGTKDDSKTKAIVGTFLALNEIADFDGETPDYSTPELTPETPQSAHLLTDTQAAPPIHNSGNFELKVGYTINLNLPETNDPEVFNSIFKALRDNLLKN